MIQTNNITEHLFITAYCMLPQTHFFIQSIPLHPLLISVMSCLFMSYPTEIFFFALSNPFWPYY